MLAVLPDLLYVYDLDEQSNVYANRETMSLLGYSPAEIAELGPSLLIEGVHPEDWPSVAAHHGGLRSADVGEMRVLNYRIRHKDGRYRWLESRDTPLLKRDGVTRQIVGVARDVTEAIEHAEKIAASEARYRKLAGELEASNARLERFAAMASHDLQEPLRHVRLLASGLMVDGESLPREVRADLALIEESAARMTSLTQAVLRMSKASSAELALQSLDMTALSRDVVGRVLQAWPDVDVRIQVDDLPAAHGDLPMVVNLLQNLLANAIKYRHPERPPHIHITYADGRFCVRDDGQGIEARFHGRIFDPFTRLHRRDEVPGHGLGLAHCAVIISRHLGELGVESTPGVGSTFWFTLPEPADTT